MVRRWSYISTLRNANFSLDSKSLGISLDNHTFKVFKKTTYFRKYNRGLTVFVRRKNILRKRKTNNIVLTFIASKWVSFYLRLRRIARYSQAKYTFRIANALSSIEAFTNKSKVLGFYSGALLTSIPNKMIRFNSSPIEHSSRNAIALSPYGVSNNDTQLSSLLFNSYIFGKYNFYKCTKLDNTVNINTIANYLSKQALQFNCNLRVILIMCTLLNIK